MHDCHMTEGYLGVQGEVSGCYGNGEVKGKYINLHFRWNAKQTMGSTWNSRDLDGGGRKKVNKPMYIKKVPKYTALNWRLFGGKL